MNTTACCDIELFYVVHIFSYKDHKDLQGQEEEALKTLNLNGTA